MESAEEMVELHAIQLLLNKFWTGSTFFIFLINIKYNTMRKNLVLLNCVLLFCYFLGSGYTTKEVTSRKPLEKLACPQYVYVKNVANASGVVTVIYSTTIKLSNGGSYNLVGLYPGQSTDKAWSDGTTITTVCFNIQSNACGVIDVYRQTGTQTSYVLISTINVNGGGNRCWTANSQCGDAFQFLYRRTCP